MKAFMRRSLGLPAAVLLLTSVDAPDVSAASLTSLGHNSGAQCAASDVNDSGVAAGACTAPNGNGPNIAWVASAGNEVSLAPLATGRSCSAAGINNNGLVVGDCMDAAGTGFAVTWTAPGTTVAKLSPLTGLLGLIPDVSTVAAAYNQNGDVAGSSISGSGTSTAVIWKSGSATAVAISSPGDNCSPVDISEPVGASNPTVLLNCPNGTGAVKAVVASQGLLGLYQMATLTPAPGASYCVAQSINTSSRIMGSCVFATAPTSRVAFWQSPTSAAVAPPITNGGVAIRTSGAFLNNVGNIVFCYQTADGKVNTAYMAITANGTVTTVAALPPLHAGTTVSATGFGDNDLVAVTGQNGSEHAQAAVWSPVSPGVLTAVPLSGGGATSELTSVSKSGSYAVGAADDSSHVENAVVTVLP